MRSQIDIDTWARKDHFHFFRQFEEPFFGLTTQVACGRAYSRAKEMGVSFFLYYLYLSLRAANHIRPFKYRIEGNDVWEYDTVHASPTINRPDGTFGFAYMDYQPGFEQFATAAQAEADRVRTCKGLVPALSGQNVIHYSSIPWINFTALSHARSFRFNDSVPKISFGKMTTVNGKTEMPVSIHAHHALMDGYDVGQYLEYFQDLLEE